ncbi:MAG TPA: hypothetical protein VGP68_09110 [Gemmataceae bacterium]|jgi:hypothetical protein|nr:hypothetical protein [Gemmataceae bacterium]
MLASVLSIESSAAHWPMQIMASKLVKEFSAAGAHHLGCTGTVPIFLRQGVQGKAPFCLGKNVFEVQASF